MTQDEIIRMAREAELYSYLWGGDINQQSLEALERFAALVAAHEREKLMALCEAEYKKYDELITEEDAGHEEATAIIHLMRKLEGMK